MGHNINNSQFAFWMSLVLMASSLFACSTPTASTPTASKPPTVEKVERFVLAAEQRSVELKQLPADGSLQVRLSPAGTKSVLLHEDDLTLAGAKLKLSSSVPAGTVIDVAYRPRR